MSEHKAVAADRLARHYALAMLEMQGDIKRQRQFIEIKQHSGVLFQESLTS